LLAAVHINLKKLLCVNKNISLLYIFARLNEPVDSTNFLFVVLMCFSAIQVVPRTQQNEPDDVKSNKNTKSISCRVLTIRQLAVLQALAKSQQRGKDFIFARFAFSTHTLFLVLLSAGEIHFQLQRAVGCLFCASSLF